jgi:hypothetical protein
VAVQYSHRGKIGFKRKKLDFILPEFAPVEKYVVQAVAHLYASLFIILRFLGGDVCQCYEYRVF